MRFLRDLFEIEDLVSRTEAPDALPRDTMDKIQKSIRDGLKPDKETGQYQKWANALHLVHKAYQVNGIQRPVPTMKDAWKQYEENIAYAVQQLANAFGMDGDWRLSASVFHEAKEMAKGKGVPIEVKEGDMTSIFKVSAKDAEDLLESVTEIAEQDGYVAHIKEEHGRRVVTFWRNNVKRKDISLTLHS